MPEKVGSMQYFLHGYQGTSFCATPDIVFLIVRQIHQNFYENIPGLDGLLPIPLMIQRIVEEPSQSGS